MQSASYVIGLTSTNTNTSPFVKIFPPRLPMGKFIKYIDIDYLKNIGPTATSPLPAA
jgi:hypothetical protein